MAGPSLNALSMVIGMNTDQVTAGVGSIRQQLGRANRIMQMSKTAGDKLTEGVTALTVAYKRGARDRDEYIKGMQSLQERYLSTSKASSETVASEKRVKQLVEQSRPAVAGLVKDMRLLIAAKRDGSVGAVEFAQTQAMLKKRMAELRAEEKRQKEELSGTTAARKIAADRLRRVQQAVQSSIPATTKLAIEIRELRKEYAAGNIGATEFSRTNSHLRKRLEELRTTVDRSTPQMDKARRKFQEWKLEQDNASSKTIPKLIRSLKGLAIAYVSVAAARRTAAGVGAAVSVAEQMESDAIAFEVYTGSAENGKRLMEELISMASETPLEYTQLTNAARTMLAFGVSLDEILPSLRQLGDISGGDAERLDRLAYVFSQVATNGKLMGQDLIQFVNAGFSPLQQISEDTGESMESLRKKMEKGLITFDMVKQSMESITTGTGRAAGMMDKFAKTTQGGMAILNSEWQLLQKDFAEGFGVFPNWVKVKGDMSRDVAGLIRWFRGLYEEEKKVEEQTEEVGKAVSKARSAAVSFSESRELAASRQDEQTHSLLQSYSDQNVQLQLGAEYLERQQAARRGATEEQLEELQKLQKRNKMLREEAELAKRAEKALEDQQKRLDELVNRGMQAGGSSYGPTQRAAEMLSNLRTLLDSDVIDVDQFERASKHIEDMAAKGQELRDSLKTPFELASEEIARLMQLLRAGFIDSATFHAAASKAAKDSMSNTEAPTVAAIEKGSQEAYQRLTGQINDRREKELAKMEEQRLLQSAMVAAQRETNRRIAELQPVRSAR